MSPFPIAYIAGAFPLRSETFVWREVLELRSRGWTVHTFGLRPPEEPTPPELAPLREQTRYVYELPVSRALGIGTSQVQHARTGLVAHRDALQPGEALRLTDRVKLIVQAHRGAAWGQQLQDLGVRHVHAHFAHAPTSVAMYAAHYAGIPFSFTGHANDLFQRRQLLGRKLARAAFVACISRWHEGFYRAIEPSGTYHVIRCGVEPSAYAGPSPRQPGRPLKVLSVARLVEKKGLDTLIQAAQQVPHVQVTIAGSGPQMGYLQRLTADYGLGARIRFLGGVDPSAVPGLLAEHDAFALPCRPTAAGDRDGIPVALMEAMAAGLPVLAGNLPAIRELIEDGRSGRLVAPATAEGVAAVLRDWSSNAEAATALGHEARRRVREEFSLKINVDRLEKALWRASGGSADSGG